MSFIQKEIFYFGRYSSTTQWSLLYMIGLALIGLFLILRRESLLGLVLTSSARASLIIGSGISLMLNLKEGNHYLDVIVIVITFIILSAIILLSKSLANRGKSSETLYAILLVVISACLPLLIKIFSNSEAFSNKTYFTEILYTEPEAFYNMLPIFLIGFILLLLFMKPIFRVSFDYEFSSLAGMHPIGIETIFYFSTGLVISSSVRVLGIYLAMAYLLIPGFIALLFSRNLITAGILAVVFTLFANLIGFATAFQLDSWPTEPVLIATLGLLATIIYAVLLGFNMVFEKLKHNT